jgi:hypothetical protein
VAYQGYVIDVVPRKRGGAVAPGEHAVAGPGVNGLQVNVRRRVNLSKVLCPA